MCGLESLYTAWPEYDGVGWLIVVNGYSNLQPNMEQRTWKRRVKQEMKQRVKRKQKGNSLSWKKSCGRRKRWMQGVGRRKRGGTGEGGLWGQNNPRQRALEVPKPKG
ncbi:hypothetical protein QQF64_029947 [Cirrhinus molitorella]|uniref:Uncharacterized protein n=1 Tax=Cirrhinus molitorella TaxID=172907 RepID=A0ABR3N293_9TELE